jgi:hypothetical protein
LFPSFHLQNIGLSTWLLLNKTNTEPGQKDTGNYIPSYETVCGVVPPGMMHWWR